VYNVELALPKVYYNIRLLPLFFGGKSQNENTINQFFASQANQDFLY